MVRVTSGFAVIHQQGQKARLSCWAQRSRGPHAQVLVPGVVDAESKHLRLLFGSFPATNNAYCRVAGHSTALLFKVVNSSRTIMRECAVQFGNRFSIPASFTSAFQLGLSSW